MLFLWCEVQSLQAVFFPLGMFLVLTFFCSGVLLDAGPIPEEGMERPGVGEVGQPMMTEHFLCTMAFA